MTRKPLPLRWRLTLWYMAFLAAALLLFGAGFYAGLSRLLYDGLDADARGQVAAALALIDESGGRPRADTEQLRALLEDDQFIRLVDSAGREVAVTDRDLDEDEIEGSAFEGGIADALAGRTVYAWVDEGERLRVLSQPLRLDGQVVGALQLGIADDEVEETLSFTRRVLLIAVPLALALAGAGGAWIAGRALAPVGRITRLAAEIEERDLSRRIDLALPDDEIGRLARTFNAMLDRIETAFLRQRRFTADAAHELRTPLALMQGQLDLALRDGQLSGEQRGTLETLQGDVERLSRISGALLMLARGDAARIELSREEVDLAALLDLVAEHYRAAAEEAGVELVIDAAPVTMVGDEDRLVQVLVNLVENALRHTPPAKRITLGCRQEGERARLWVADEGTGIEAEHLPHLFERFYRVDGGRDRQRGGIGLGLSITKMLVEAHGGEITVESRPGEGTTMTVTLPREK